MGLQPPSPQSGVARNDVGNVVEAMLLDSRVQWIAIVLEQTAGGAEQFSVTPYIEDPTTG